MVVVSVCVCVCVCVTCSSNCLVTVLNNPSSSVPSLTSLACFCMAVAYSSKSIAATAFNSLHQ